MTVRLPIGTQVTFELPSPVASTRRWAAASRWAEMSGIHCPTERPCARCTSEREIERLTKERDEAVTAKNVANEFLYTTRLRAEAAEKELRR